MNIAIKSVLEKKNTILEETIRYMTVPDNGNNAEYNRLYDFFDRTFNDDEIKVIITLMYAGREYYSQNLVYNGECVEEIFYKYSKFIIGLLMEGKEMLIHQMIEKKNKIGIYFETIFNYI